ncbi:Z1 domain-containing protein [Streptomyces xinghaiensis]|uniref:Z1 domain-containing protein n=1 Tax=Streptomyces xinghaiensis TaxID=1038928 RepID=UPI00031C5D5D|nr:Z1 domain-containing protein [Streptomyces xinghaiensis]MZE80334.1 endonuclease [Streptomyces sp. SID5475]
MTTEDTSAASSAHGDLYDLHDAALAGMRKKGPKPLARALRFYAEDMDHEGTDLTEAALRDVLSTAHTDHALLWLWRRQLADWDFDSRADWTDTEPRTEERRAAIHAGLGLEPETRKVLDTLIPVSKLTGPVVISREFTPWRGRREQQGHHWYWPRYAELLARKGWDADAVANLDEAAERVVERLADPTAEQPYQSRGLVVGYVQSGKTANFTGVIAKAVDAGYRLVIVLGGTLNLLRAQTQRRLDMELVGRENILRGASEVESDYAADEAWVQDKFLRHGGLPSTRGAFDIIRLTTRDNDYKPLAQGIGALEIEKREQTLPLYDPRNLRHSAARLMVVKKNKSVLAKLVTDLKKIGPLLSEIPVLIIDDESDEASVNTTSPSKPDANRTAINEKISELLQLMPRAQYVGYTATPFANVFIDPSDTEDVFPRDFILSLDRPAGYMGVQDFHDLDSAIPPEERTFANSQEKAHVRDVRKEDEEDDACLREAMDMFVLTAAMKVYRECAGPEPLGTGHFRHHTMLVHESRLQRDHRELAAKLLRLWYDGGYAGPSGRERLHKLYDADVAPVSAARADGFAVPADFEELAPHIGAAWMRIGGNENPVIVVNGDQDIERGEADFDRRGIWKILVGGQKLSRGYTVEGLTVTYYRRSAGNASTLMQMGRWFGFRKGYRDLVRLYIGRGETLGAKEVDLYEAFEAICRDEETFREQLKQYAVLIDGKPQITPAQVPPLVSQHLPWLKPTSPSKMFNAELVEIRSPGLPVEPASYPTTAAAIRRNTERWRPVLDVLGGTPVLCSNPPDESSQLRRTFSAYTGVVDHSLLISVLSQLEWSKPETFLPHLAYLSQLDGALAKVDDWLVLAPQLSSPQRVEATVLGSIPLSLVQRSRQRGKDSFGRIAGLEHHKAAKRMVELAAASQNHAALPALGPRQGVLLLYPVIDSTRGKGLAQAVHDGAADPAQVIMAFSLVPPKAAIDSSRRLVRFRVKDSQHAEEAIVTLGSE